MKNYNFDEIKSILITSLTEILQDDGTNYNIIEGFTVSAIIKNINSPLRDSGPFFPQVTIVNKITGEVKNFAIEMLLNFKKSEI